MYFCYNFESIFTIYKHTHLQVCRNDVILQNYIVHETKIIGLTGYVGGEVRQGLLGQEKRDMF